MIKRQLCMFVICCIFLGMTPPIWAASDTKSEATIAYHPFASPVGPMAEMMKRDRILRQEFAKAGLNLRFVPALKGADLIAPLSKGELDFAFTGDLPLIETVQSVPVATIAQIKHHFASVVASRGSSVQDLRGKRIGNAWGSTGHYTLLKILKTVGLSEKDVKLVALDLPDMPVALLQGKIDAFAAWEPTPSSVIEQHPDKYSIVGRQESNAFLVVTRHFSDRYPAQVQALAAAVARSMAWLAKGNRQLDQAVVWNNETRKELAPKTEHPSHEALKNQYRTDLQMLNYSAKLSPRIQSSGGLLADELEFMKAIGKLPKDATWEAVRKSLAPAVMERVYRNPTASGLNRFDYDLK